MCNGIYAVRKYAVYVSNTAGTKNNGGAVMTRTIKPIQFKTFVLVESPKRGKARTIVQSIEDGYARETCANAIGTWTKMAVKHTTKCMLFMVRQKSLPLPFS